MYRVINQNIDRILGNVDEELDIRTYLTLLNRFRNVDVTRDTEFQGKYCRYWRLFGAGLGRTFRSAYFELMEGLKGKPIPSIKEVARILYEVPVNKKGVKKLQFSFASKLLHTLDPHRPIYDSMVATFYGFTAPAPNKTFEVRLQSFVSFYGFLVTEYNKVLSNGSIEQAIADFRRRFSVPDEYTDEKVIDTLIWRAMAIQKKGLFFPELKVEMCLNGVQSNRERKSAERSDTEKQQELLRMETSQSNILSKDRDAIIEGTVTSQGKYVDGKDICELYITKDTSDRLPHEYRKRKPIDILVGNSTYEANVHETKNGVVWVSSKLFKKEPRREKIKLVDALAEINVRKGDKVAMKLNEDGIYVLQKI